MSYAKNFLEMDKIDRLLDAMEHPERYTALEIEEMLRDPEMKDVLELLYKTKSSIQTIVTPDIEEEWEAFVDNHSQYATPRRHWLPRPFSRNAAASVAVWIASFTAVAAIVGMGIHSINNSLPATAPEVVMTALADTVALRPDTVKPTEALKGTAVEVMVFDDETLEAIMDLIALHYGYKVTFNSNAGKSLRLYYRWNQAQTLDEVVEGLNNFDQIHISVNDRTINID